MRDPLKKQRRFTVCTAGRDSDTGALQEGEPHYGR